MIRRVAFVIALAAAGPLPASAQSSATFDTGRYLDQAAGMTLDEAIALGLRVEPGLQAVRTTVEAARGERRQAALYPNPQVSVEQRDPVVGAGAQTQLGVALPLDLRRAPRLLAADRAVDVAEAGVDDRARLLAAAIRDRFGDVLTAVRRVEVLDEIVEVNRRTLDLLRGRVDAGAAAPLDRDLADVELRRLEALREQAAGRVETAMAVLKPLVGLDAGARLRLRGSLETLAPAPQIPAPTDPSRRADVREAAARGALAGALVSQARELRKPEVGVFAGYMRMDGGMSHDLAGGVRLTIPIFDRGQGAIAAAAAREKGAAREIEARQLEARSEAEAARARLEAAARAVAVFGAPVRALARANLDVVRETYTLGRGTLFDVLNEQRRYLDFENAYIDALAESFAAQTALKRATGELP